MVNEMLYWDNGTPFQGIQVTNDPVEMLYWDQGVPYQFVFTTTTVNNVTQVLLCLGVGS